MCEINIARIVRMPGVLNKLFTSFHKKLGVFEKITSLLFSVSTIVDLLKGGTECL